MKNTKVSFIVPSWHYYLDPTKHQPYWELYYATHVKKSFENVEIVDMRVSKEQTLEASIDKIEKSDFYFYWIFKTGDAREIYSIVSLLKKKFPNSVHAAGGTHVDMCSDECREIFDAIILGSGEESFSQIINDKLQNNLSKVYFKNYKEKPFAETEFPDRSFLSKDLIVNDKQFSQFGNYNSTLVYFSRGCIFKCAYCTYNVPRLLQVKSPNKIKEEIQYLKKEYNINALLVKDEVAISPNEKISTATLNTIGEENIVWRGQTISLAKYSQLKLAKDSGCLELAIGVETVDNNVMKIIDKTWQNEKIIREFIDNAKKIGIKIKLCLILGLPGEPKDIVSKTIKFLEDTEPEFVSVSGFLPVPGSPIQKNYKKYGIKYIDNDWNKYGHLMHRFSDEEEIGLPFEYEEDTEWGKSFTKKEISNNIVDLQNWCRSKSMLY